jgi:hypothetical protein
MSKIDCITASLVLMTLVILYVIIMSWLENRKAQRDKRTLIMKYSAQILHSIYIPSLLVFSLPTIAKLDSTKTAIYLGVLFTVGGATLYLYDLLLYNVFKLALKAKYEELAVIRKQLRFLSEKVYNTSN